MATVKIDFKGLENLGRKGVVTKAFQRKLGETVKEAVLDSVKIGKSPVAGHGRFAGYAVDRSAASDSSKAEKKRASRNPRLYPNTVKKKFPQKRKRPVNLSLRGKMLKFIDWRPSTAGIIFGLISAPKEIEDIFEAHNEGTLESRNVPRRPVIPSKNGEKFSSSIIQKINAVFLTRIRQVIQQNNKR